MFTFPADCSSFLLLNDPHVPAGPTLLVGTSEVPSEILLVTYKMMSRDSKKIRLGGIFPNYYGVYFFLLCQTKTTQPSQHLGLMSFSFPVKTD